MISVGVRVSVSVRVRVRVGVRVRTKRASTPASRVPTTHAGTINSGSMFQYRLRYSSWHSVVHARYGLKAGTEVGLSGVQG